MPASRAERAHSQLDDSCLLSDGGYGRGLRFFHLRLRSSQCFSCDLLSEVAPDPSSSVFVFGLRRWFRRVEDLHEPGR